MDSSLWKSRPVVHITSLTVSSMKLVPSVIMMDRSVLGMPEFHVAPHQRDSYGRDESGGVGNWVHFCYVKSYSLPHGLRCLIYYPRVVMLIISYDHIEHFCPGWLLLPPPCDAQELQEIHYLSS